VLRAQHSNPSAADQEFWPLHTPHGMVGSMQSSAGLTVPVPGVDQSAANPGFPASQPRTLCIALPLFHLSHVSISVLPTLASEPQSRTLCIALPHLFHVLMRMLADCLSRSGSAAWYSSPATARPCAACEQQQRHNTKWPWRFNMGRGAQGGRDCCTESDTAQHDAGCCSLCIGGHRSEFLVHMVDPLDVCANCLGRTCGKRQSTLAFCCVRPCRDQVVCWQATVLCQPRQADSAAHCTAAP
jgi:hypothetical protein